jgi:hypothetical protein
MNFVDWLDKKNWRVDRKPLTTYCCSVKYIYTKMMRGGAVW